MATNGEIGTIEKSVKKKTYEETHIEWRIPYITTIKEIKNNSSSYKSPSFFINDASFILVLYPNSALNSEFMRLFIKSNVEQEFSPEYNISLKKLDGTLQHLVSGIPKKTSSTWFDMGDIIKRSQLLEQKCELAPHDVFIIICTFKRELNDCTEPLGKAMPLKLIRLDKLSENFKDLLGNQETCDTTLKVKDKEYKAHRSVLIARSSVFAATFRHDTLEKQTGVITISDCDPDSFKKFLDYLYSGKLEELSSRNALNMHYICDKYDVQELKEFCMEYLMQHLTVEDICEVAVFADKYDDTALFSAVQDFFNENAGKIFATSEWQCFMKNENRLASQLLLEMSKVKLKG